ncbi:GntP family transporter [Arthrobacter sp. MYb211]|uniref:GntP family transporter n=1 Tax=unclassified Arthrobacter TaxID=235627 RepID=UPI000CFAF663|nr:MULTISPECIES: GntP family transporter [unclassified Arthrobacter]PRA10266.1 GntP family transporter [Arthrobacter sp. MYb221]PRC05646.1 GntP family transporter [Arthrobacter sp. MYb211]
MSPLLLLLIAVAGVALLLVGVIKFKMPAFIALLLVSILVALAAGIPLQDVAGLITEGMGGTLGSVAVLVGLGAMLGKVIEISGGAQVLSTRFTKLFGPRRVIAALTTAAFLLAIPVFFDVGFIVLVPIIYGFAKALNVSPVKIGLPVGAIMLAIHVVVPPHPGVVGGAEILGADVGWATILGLAFCAPLGVLSYFVAKRINRRDVPMLPETAEQFASFGKSTDAGDTLTKTKAPTSSMVISMILLPIVMIMLGTVGGTLVTAESTAANVLGFVGSPAIALLTTVLVAYYLLGVRSGWSSEQTGKVMDSALAPAAIVILVTGAGGVFGKVLTESGIGTVLAESLSSAGLPIIVMAFVLAAILRASQGSATVAIITTTGLLATAVEAGGFSTVQTALILAAVGFGAFGLSHVNDSGFWIVTRFLGLSVADGLRTWTVLTTVLGVAGFALTSLVYAIVTAAGV